MRIDAFEEAINCAKCEMQKGLHFRSHATINKFLKIQTGQSVSEVKQTTLPIKPVEEDNESFKKINQLELDEAIKELTKKLELYKNVCIDYQRPDNLTLQALFEAIMTSYSQSQLNQYQNVISTHHNLQEMQSYLTRTLINLIEKDTITLTEGRDLLTLFYQKYNLSGIEEDRIFESKQIDNEKWSNRQQESIVKMLEKNQKIYKSVCIDHQRPDHLTMQDLYSALMQNFELHQVILLESKNSISTQEDTQKRNDYLNKKISDLLCKNMINPKEADALTALLHTTDIPQEITEKEPTTHSNSRFC